MKKLLWGIAVVALILIIVAAISHSVNVNDVMMDLHD